MTNKFKRVLSNEEIVQVIAGLSIDPLFSYRHVANAIQYAMLAKLAEQEPVATVSQETFSSDGTSDIITSNLPIGTPLYAHPMPCVSPTSDKTACVSESRENDRQLARHQPCGCIICYCENQERCLGCGAKHCGTHDLWEIPNPVYVDHIADKRKKVPEGYTLVPAEADQALLISMACCLNHGFGLLDKEAQYSMLYDMEKLYDEVVGAGYYSQENRGRYLNMLADEHKYKGEGNDTTI